MERDGSTSQMECATRQRRAALCGSVAACVAAGLWLLGATASCAELFGRGTHEGPFLPPPPASSSAPPPVDLCPLGSGDCDNDPSNGCETEFEPWETKCSVCDPACPEGFTCRGGTCRDADPTVKVSAGGQHTCALRRSGAVVCWGDNEEGQLGDGTTIGRARPVRARGINDAIDLAVGSAHSCVVRASGAVACWGDNASRQLGHDNGTESPLPSPVPGIRDAVQITAAVVHTCALLSNGKALCWGSSESGQLGDGTVDRRSMPPVNVQWPQVQILQISAGSSHTCAINRLGAVACWGRNDQGQLGDGTTAPQRPSPTPVRGLTQPTQIAAGGFHSCSVRVKGDVMCWGSGPEGQLGGKDGLATSSKPTPVLELSNVVQVAVGWKHSCARQSAGEALCWGSNQAGQLGVGESVREPHPARVPKIGPISWISAGLNHTCAVLEAHGVMCWGENIKGQLGDGSRVTRIEPVRVAGLY